jgi:prepilin-type processing-associated H-X9-DG protein
MPGHLSYVYLGKGRNMMTRNNVVLAHEAPSNHANQGMNVLFGDGHVDWFDAQSAPRLLGELQAGHNPPRFLAP